MATHTQGWGQESIYPAPFLGCPRKVFFFMPPPHCHPSAFKNKNSGFLSIGFHVYWEKRSGVIKGESTLRELGMFSRVKGQEREVVDWSQQGPYFNQQARIWNDLGRHSNERLKGFEKEESGPRQCPWKATELVFRSDPVLKNCYVPPHLARQIGTCLSLWLCPGTLMDSILYHRQGSIAGLSLAISWGLLSVPLNLFPIGISHPTNVQFCLHCMYEARKR